ncbi:MAG: hypothetical protein HON90_12580, partial [Halobacteriovoraceae bacterium]|nr:hypothetical protein [Halobacteriovoraceae bacterium]
SMEFRNKLISLNYFKSQLKQASRRDTIAYLRTETLDRLKEGRGSKDFIAYINDFAVASGGFSITKDYAFLGGGAVNPKYRKQGVYRTLLSHRMDIISEMNLPAVIHCLKKTSAPICLRLGFEKVCEIFSFEAR